MPAIGHHQCPWLAGPMTSFSSCCYGFFGAGFVELHHLTVLSSFNTDPCGAYTCWCAEKGTRHHMKVRMSGCLDGWVRIQRFDSKQGWNKSETIQIYANLIHSNILFPSCDAPLLMQSSSQNFAKTTYYYGELHSADLMKEMPAQSARWLEISLTITGKWLPSLAQANRIWCTKLQANLVFLGGPGSICPQLILNLLLVQSIASLRCGAHPTRIQWSHQDCTFSKVPGVE